MARQTKGEKYLLKYFTKVERSTLKPELYPLGRYQEWGQAIRIEGDLYKWSARRAVWGPKIPGCGGCVMVGRWELLYEYKGELYAVYGMQRHTQRAYKVDLADLRDPFFVDGLKSDRDKEILDMSEDDVDMRGR